MVDDINPEQLSSNRSHVAKGRAIQINTSLPNSRETYERILADAKKLSMKHLLTHFEDMLKIVFELRKMLHDMKIASTADGFLINQAQSKIERLEIENAKLSQDNQALVRHIAKSGDFETRQSEYHEGSSQMPAD